MHPLNVVKANMRKGDSVFPSIIISDTEVYECFWAGHWQLFGSCDFGYSAERLQKVKRRKGWVMTGPQRNVESSQHQFTSALCWTTQEERVENNVIYKVTFLFVWTAKRFKCSQLSGIHSEARHLFHATFQLDNKHMFLFNQYVLL